MTWRNFPDNPHTYDGPSPSVLERADDEQYGGDFATMVAVFRTQLEADGLPAILIRFHAVLKGKYFTSGEQWLADFQERWGNAAVLRALARAVESPEHILVDTVEHP